MVKVGVTVCPYCGGVLEHYDTVQRTALGKRRVKKTLYIDRDRCQQCGRYHREIPDTIYPYKQYEADIVDGVKEEWITNETLGFEDFPCDSTIIRWTTHFSQVAL